MTQNKNYRKRWAVVVLGIVTTLGMGTAAATSSISAVVQSYSASGDIQNGMVVRLDSKDATKVDVDTVDTAQKMIGVVISPTDAAVTLSPSGTNANQTYVASSGRYNVLVSNQNGVISSGDYVTISALAGVAMKSDSTATEVLGRAATGFDGVHNVKSTTTVHTKNGKSITVSIGELPVDIAISVNPQAVKIAGIPGFLQRSSQLIADKPVSPWRAYAGLAILIGAMLVSGSLLYSGVRNGITAIGRNPLARSPIIGSLLQVTLTSIIVFMLGLLGVYVLLKL